MEVLCAGFRNFPYKTSVIYFLFILHSFLFPTGQNMKLVAGVTAAILDHELNLGIEGTSNSFKIGEAYVLEKFMEQCCHIRSILCSDFNIIEK